MTYELFVPQLDNCVLCGGRAMGGLDCTCASMAMWLFRASQGKIRTTSCHVRDLTNDCSGGNTLDQMTSIADHYGIKGYTLYKPTTTAHLQKLLQTGRYGAIFDIDYSPLANTVHDCFRGNFFGNHAVYGSLGYTRVVRYGDPGADNRDGASGGIPNGYQLLDWYTAWRAAGMLQVNGTQTLNQRNGPGHVYALLTPADPPASVIEVDVAISGPTALYSSPGGHAVRNVAKASYRCEARKDSGAWWYRIVTRSDGTTAANKGLYFRPGRYTDSTRIQP
jgi:hypothetical protein